MSECDNRAALEQLSDADLAAKLRAAHRDYVECRALLSERGWNVDVRVNPPRIDRSTTTTQEL